MSLIFKQLYNGESVKTNNGLVFKILTIGADDTSFTPTPSLVYTLSSDGTYYIVGTGFTDVNYMDGDDTGGTAGSGLDSTWTGGDLYIPNTYNDKAVKGIAPRAFEDITNITNCYIQEGITHIGHRAFLNNGSTYALKSIELPKSLVSLGGASGRVFSNCYSLNSIDLRDITTLVLRTFYGCKTLQNVKGSNVTKIGKRVFELCGELENVSMLNLLNIGEMGFADCTKLRNINFPKLTNIDGYAFQNNVNMISAYLPQVETIKEHTFSSCNKLESIVLGKVTIINNYAFYMCSELKCLIIQQSDSVCTLKSWNAFQYASYIEYDNGGYIYVPDSLVDSYKNATNWSSYANVIKPLSELPQEYKDLYNIA